MFSDFFNVNDDSFTFREFKNKTLKIYNNDLCYTVLRDVADAASFLIRTVLDDDPEVESIKVNFEDDYNDFFLISDYFNRKLIRITVENLTFLKAVSEFFQISSLMLKINEFERHYQIITKNSDLAAAETFQSIIHSLNEDNYENVAENMLDFNFMDLNETKSESDYEIIGSIILKLSLNRYLSAPLLFKFAKLLNNQTVTSTIIDLAYKIKKNSVKNYIFQKITETGLSNSLKFYNYSDESVYFHLYSSQKIDDNDDDDYMNTENNFYNYYAEFLHHYNEIKKEIDDYVIQHKLNETEKDDQKPQKKPFLNLFRKSSESDPNEMTRTKFCDICKNLRSNGVNPSLLCSSIRNDDVDLFQRISSNDEQFDFSQKVPFSRFESSSMLIKCSIAEYAAFFGSVKCFKYILINYNNASTFSSHEKKIVKYAIAGGNVEIIRLCEQNGCIFGNYALKSCIRFHNDEIFEWIIMNKVTLYGMNMGCTVNITGKHYVKQPWFECETCGITKPYGCCLYCATHCHKDHKLLNRSLQDAYCDCGIIKNGRHFCKGRCRVICKNESENEKTDDQNTIKNEGQNSNQNNDGFDRHEIGDFDLLLDDEEEEQRDDNSDDDWAPVNNIVLPRYRSNDIIDHLDIVNLCQIDNLVFVSVKYHNYGALHRLIELGANLIETYPKFFTMAATTNNVRLARLAIELGKSDARNKYVTDTIPQLTEGSMSKEMKKLGTEALKKEIIYIEKSCNIC